MVAKGRDFETRAASWIKRGGLNRLFGGQVRTLAVEPNLLVNGNSSNRPYEVDVSWSLEARGSLLPRWTARRLWIECKHLSRSIRRNDISVLEVNATDVVSANMAGKESTVFDGWVFVSSSRFDEDALARASTHNILCVQATDSSFTILNADDMVWL